MATPRRSSFLQALLVLFIGLLLWGVTPALQARETAPLIESVRLADLPPEAAETLQLIRRGGPFPYPRKDGSVFGNFEKQLPPQQRGYYREYTVPTPGSRNRGARRIVAGQGRVGDVARSGEYYYTANHYRSFSRISEP